MQFASHLSSLGRMGSGTTTIADCLFDMIDCGGAFFQINQFVSDEERDVGRILAANPEPQAVYTYGWDYWDSIRYYSNRKSINGMQEDLALTETFFLITDTQSGYQFPPELQKHFEKVYSSPALTMYKFSI